MRITTVCVTTSSRLFQLFDGALTAATIDQLPSDKNSLEATTYATSSLVDR